MKRQRFVKLLMSQGVQRNAAQRTASAVTAIAGFRGSYKRLYACVWFIHGIWNKTSIPEIAKIICDTWLDRKTPPLYFGRHNGRDYFPWIGNIDFAAGKDKTAIVTYHGNRRADICTMEALTPEQHAAVHRGQRNE